MNNFDITKIETWKPYAILTLTAGAIASVGTILSFGGDVYKWCCESRPPEFSGDINGLGGYADLDNSEFEKFLSGNIGGVVELAIYVYVIGPADLTAGETTCTSTNAPNGHLFDPTASENSNTAVMDHEEMQQLYELSALKPRLLGFQEKSQEGDSFVLTHQVVPCLSAVVSSPAESITFVASGAHGSEFFIEGTFRVAYEMFGFDDHVPHYLLTGL